MNRTSASILAAIVTLSLAACTDDTSATLPTTTGAATSIAKPTSTEPVTTDSGPYIDWRVTSSETLKVGTLSARVDTADDGRFYTCITDGVDVPKDAYLCIGPFDGRQGAKYSWSSAQRFGDDVVVFVIHSPEDRILDDRLFSARSATNPVAVTAGVVHNPEGAVMCLVYWSQNLKYHYDVGISSAETSSAAPVGGSCA